MILHVKIINPGDGWAFLCVDQDKDEVIALAFGAESPELAILNAGMATERLIKRIGQAPEKIFLEIFNPNLRPEPFV